ncbi:cell filamentation protein Fic [Moraxella caviae]|uniref:Cell filamentation protein Fic n=1 Tax=Moraxella caviae TaxID=34060 RepID=A0A1S9ZYT8_9GAMM|nr:Fic family protein [Moraxella caviae]OOR88121.1 cell filamentation protein Fic [Moraxella caviae]
MFAELDALKGRLDCLRPFDPAVLASVQNDLMVRWTYHSNAIEGNTLSLFETKVVLEHGITVGGKALTEHLECINHKEAILYLLDVVANHEPFSEWQIKNIHQLILKGIDDKNAGRYRAVDVLISGASHKPPSSVLLDEKMLALIAWHHQADLHPVYKAAKLHADFVIIHPFIDGNGRTARLLMNLELMKAGFLPSVITVESRLAYYQALDSWANGDEMPFVQFVIDSQMQAFEWYGKTLGL